MNSLDKARDLRHHAFVIEAEAEEGIEVAQAWAVRELGMKIENNPDVVVLCYGLLTVDDARKVFEVASGAAFVGEQRVIIIAASRAYHEAQNALLKLFEEPPVGTYLFFVLPSLGGLLPTLRSRVQILNPCRDVRRPTSDVGRRTSYIPKAAEEFMKASKEKRSVIIKRLTSGKDEEERRELRDEAIAILNGVEAVAYQRRGDTLQQGVTSPFPQGVILLLSDIAILRGHLYDRSAPVKMILEHLSLVIPKNLS
ncbi:MAG: hypothetical protein WCS97_02730 [Candidatus Paceibacterota bacterium]|jgi:DNA polymerase III delta prime subunit